MGKAPTDTIVPAGVQGATPFTIGQIPYISDDDPQTIAASAVAKIVNAGAGTEAIILGGADPEPTASEKTRITGGLISEGAGEDSTILGRGVISTGARAVAIGDGALVQADDTIAIGENAWAPTGTSMIAIGQSSGYPGSGVTVGKVIAIGKNANVRVNSSASAAIAIGEDAKGIAVAGGSTQTLIAIGQGALAGWGSSMAIGHGASAGQSTNTPSMAIGNTAVSSADNSMAIGHVASSSVTKSTSIGESAKNIPSGEGGNPSDMNMVIGFNSQIGVVASSGNFRAFKNGIAIGANISTPAATGVLLAPVQDFIVIGNGFNQEPANNTCYLGGAGSPMTAVIIGSGVSNAVASSATLKTTPASGANKNGGTLSILGGEGTGAGLASSVTIRGSIPGGAGSTAQVNTTIATFSSRGMFSSDTSMIWCFGSAFNNYAGMTIKSAPPGDGGGNVAGINLNPSFSAATATTTGFGLDAKLSYAAGNYTNPLSAAIRIQPPSLGSATVALTVNEGLLIQNQGHAQVVTAAGIKIEPQTGATGANYSIQIDTTPMDFDNFTNGAGANGGTLGNAPSAGDPSFWLKIFIGGAARYIPCWT